MRKILIFIIIFFLAGNVFAEVIITEIESNPAGADSGKEWIKLYSDSKIDLSGWRLINCDGDNYELNDTIEDDFLVEFEGQWLDNSEECVKLYNIDELVDESDKFDDDANDDKTWILCDDGWEFSDNGCAKKESLEESEERETETDYAVETETADKINESVLPVENVIKTIKLGGNIENNSILNVDNKETENIKSKNYIVYESKTELIKKYAIYGFAFLIVVFCVLIMWKKLE